MTKATFEPIILGSGSPRRSALLTQFGVAFVVDAPGIDEPEGAPVDELARAKFAHLASRHAHQTILTADTLVLLGENQLGKPKNDDHARDMLRACSGKAITVVSAVCVGTQQHVELRRVESTVQLRALTEVEIARYIATGAANDKAGALELQGAAAPFVDRTSAWMRAGCEHGGCFTNVVGLPMCAVAELLDRTIDEAACDWPSEPAAT